MTGNDGQFKKGSIPWNKGVKGGGYEPTQFKKGHTPLNAKYDGYIVIRLDNRGVPQKHIREGKRRFEYLSRHNWRESFGEIPAGHCIRFKDGDTLNCDPENLECVSRTLNMLLNSKHRYTREVAEVKEVIVFINKTIKDNENENE